MSEPIEAVSLLVEDEEEGEKEDVEEAPEPEEDLEFGVCLCGSCSFPLFSDVIGASPEQDTRCGLCGWEGKTKDATIISVEDWRSYIFDPAKKTELPPLPRGVFTTSLYEQMGGISAAFADFIAKWGLLTTEDLKAPWLPKLMQRSAKAFVLTMGHGLMNPPDPPKIVEDKETPPDTEEEEEK